MAIDFTTNGVLGHYDETILGTTNTHGFLRQRVAATVRYNNTTGKGYVTIPSLLTLGEVGTVNSTGYSTAQEFSDLMNQLFG